MKRRLVMSFGILLFVVGVMLMVSPIALGLKAHELFFHLFGLTKGYSAIVTVGGLLLFFVGGILAIEGLCPSSITDVFYEHEIGP